MSSELSSEREVIYASKKYWLSENRPWRPSVSHIGGSEIGLQGMFNPFYDQLTISCFYTKEALSVWTNLGKHFVVRLVMRLKYKDWHKTQYTSRRTAFRSAFFKTYFKGNWVRLSSSRRIMRLVPFFILETHNKTKLQMFAQIRPDG